MTQLNMAAVAATADMTIQKNSQILVNVEESLADLIIVSYSADDKKFQGVLLDSNKGNLPFGVYSLHPAFAKQAPSTDEKDKLHSVSQRFAYQEPQYQSENSQRNKKPASKAKPAQKMTVRLRPRKVLCSNCKGICNENNENVDVSKKRKLESDESMPQDGESSRVEKKYLMSNMLIPKLSRLQPSEITSATKGIPKDSNKASEKSIKCETSSSSDSVTQEMAFVSVSDDMDDDQHDLKDDNDVSFSTMFSNARTLKICFGEGEGTVVKIPPLTGDFNEDSGVSCDMGKPSKGESKAAKKALKKAKKQAKKGYSDKVEHNRQSPKHIGALSPHNNLPSSPTLDPLEKKHKHKVKHKKKYKTQKNRDENMSKCTENDLVDYFSDIKEHCMSQNLSISLRRLSSNSCENDAHKSDTEEWDCQIEPDFPANGSEGAGGRLICVSPGDIVWGKVVGLPWWPGRVISVTPTSRAHIAWYASTSSSLMPCDSLSPFLEDYKIYFNKKMTGPYKEAVKQASIEAKKKESPMSDPLASPTQLVTSSPRPIDVFS